MVQTTIKLRRGGGASSILFVVFGSMIALIALLSVYTNLFARFTKKKSAEHIDFMFTYKKATNSVMVEPILFTTAVEPFIVANLSAEPYTRTDPYWHITSNSSCPLHHMGLLLADDKFIDHQYMNLYCEVFRDFRISQQKTRMVTCPHPHANPDSHLNANTTNPINILLQPLAGNRIWLWS